MTKAIRIHQKGGPEALTWEPVEVGAPGPGEALIAQTAVGLNFIDVYHRTGLYPVPAMPAIIGSEAAGVVEAAVGDGVTEVAPGDRVAYCMSVGSYTERRLIPARVLVCIPDGVSDRQAAAMMLKGCTARYLLRQTYAVQRGDTILFHAAAGGCGLIACQWAKHLGATVIGTVGTSAKAELAKAHGCDHVIIYTQENVAERVRELTGGAGLPVVYDSVGTGHVRRIARLPPAARPDGQFRQRVGTGHRLQSRATGRQGLALPDAPHAGHPHRHARPARDYRRRPVRRRLARHRQGGDQPDVSAVERGPGAPRPGSAPHHRIRRCC